MNIIAHTGLVASRIIGTKNGDFLAFAHRDLKHDRDEMKLRIAVFAPRGSRPGGIKVAQAVRLFFELDLSCSGIHSPWAARRSSTSAQICSRSSSAAVWGSSIAA